MGQYEFLPHTADVRMQVSGRNPEDLFRSALEGMMSLVGQRERDGDVPVTFEYRFSVRSMDRTTLLIDFLSDMLTASHEKRAIFYEVQFDYLDENSVGGMTRGIQVDSFDEDIKAVTYHEAEVAQESDGTWTCTIIFDI